MPSYRKNIIVAGGAGGLNAVSWVVYLPAALMATNSQYVEWLVLLAFMQLVPSLDLGLGASVSRAVSSLSTNERLAVSGLGWSLAAQIVAMCGIVLALGLFSSAPASIVSVAILGAVLLPIARLPSAIAQGAGRWGIDRSGVVAGAVIRTLVAVTAHMGSNYSVVLLASLDLSTLMLPGVLSMGYYWLWRIDSKGQERAQPVKSANLWVWLVGTSPFLIVQLPVLLAVPKAGLSVAIALGGLSRIMGLVRQSATWITEPAMREILRRPGSGFARKYLKLMGALLAIVLVGGLGASPWVPSIFKLWLGVSDESLILLWVTTITGVSAVVALQGMGVAVLGRRKEREFAVVLAPALIATAVLLAIYPPELGMVAWCISAVVTAMAGGIVLRYQLAKVEV